MGFLYLLSVRPISLDNAPSPIKLAALGVLGEGRAKRVTVLMLSLHSAGAQQVLDLQPVYFVYFFFTSLL